MKSISEALFSRTLFGAGMILVTAVSARAANPVTFSVNMTSQPGATDVFVRGSFSGWDPVSQLTDNGSGVYTGAVEVADSPGTVEQCKFFFNPGGTWEDCINNRQFLLAGGARVLPSTKWCVSD